MAKKETFSRGTKVGYLGRPGKMGSTRNDYNQVVVTQRYTPRKEEFFRIYWAPF